MTSLPQTSLAEQRRADAEYARGTSDQPIRSTVLKCITEFDLQGSVLDFGCGQAEFTRTLLSLGRFSRIAGIDIIDRPEGLDESLQWYSSDLNEPIASIPDNSFDNVIMVEVIEHLENPRAVAREVFRILKPGGKFLLTTPNNESYRSILSLLVRGHFLFFIDGWYPGHKTALLRLDLARVLREAGFVSPEFRYSNDGHMPGTGMTWQRASFGLLRGVRFSDNLLAICSKE